MGSDDLAWKGCPPPRRSGGFVEGVGLNDRSHALAVDPDGVVVPEHEPAGRGGPTLAVQRLDDVPGPTQPNGRVRLP